MGGHYPTSRNFHGSFTRDPNTSFRVPSGIAVVPRNRPGFFTPVPGPVKPATFDPATWSGMPDDPWDVPYGKQPYTRNGTFPNPWRPRKVPFGKRGPKVFPSPLGFPKLTRFMPVIGAGLGVATWWFYKPSNPADALTAAGYQCCCGSAAGDVYYFMAPIVSWGCTSESISYCGITFQPYMGDWPAPLPAVPGGYGSRLLVGKKYDGSVENPGPADRCTWVGHWVRPHIPGNDTLPPVEIGPPITIPMVPYLRPLDPNFEWPLVPYVPVPVPRPVWGNDPTRPKQPSYPPKTTGGNTYPPSKVITYPRPAPRPNPYFEFKKVGDPHRPVRPDPRREDENKYTISKRGPFAALATGLLWAASKAYNGITETVDLVAAIYSALPSEVIAQHPNNLTDSQKLPFMLGAIWQHRAQIDMAEALTNIAANAIEDAAWGRYFKTLNQVRRNSGTDVEGFDRTLGEINEVFRELYG